MLYDIYAEFFSVLEYYLLKAFEFLTQKSIILLIIQGVLITFSVWDKNSRFFVILALIGVYGVYGCISVWVSLRRRAIASSKLEESRKKQYDRSIDARRNEQTFRTLFIPVKELSEADIPMEKLYLTDNFKNIIPAAVTIH